jgi:prevent-host-death family protein
MKNLSASDFKAKCLSILDDIVRTGDTVTITKRGKPVARLVPYLDKGKTYPQDRLKGSVKVVGDIVSPVWSA